MAAASADAGGAPHASAARRNRSAAPTAAAAPSVFATTRLGPAIQAAAASSSVHNGAVDPETGEPGL
jgi:hypothetical protein